MPDCNTKDCPLVPRVEALEEANKQHSATHREIFKRLGDTETATAVQGKHMESIDNSLTEIKADQKSILKKVEGMEAKPAQRWNKVVETILVSLVTGVVCFLLGRMGL